MGEAQSPIARRPRGDRSWLGTFSVLRQDPQLRRGERIERERAGVFRRDQAALGAQQAHLPQPRRLVEDLVARTAVAEEREELGARRGQRDEIGPRVGGRREGQDAAGGEVGERRGPQRVVETRDVRGDEQGGPAVIPEQGCRIVNRRRLEQTARPSRPLPRVPGDRRAQRGVERRVLARREGAEDDDGDVSRTGNGCRWARGRQRPRAGRPR